MNSEAQIVKHAEKILEHFHVQTSCIPQYRTYLATIPSEDVIHMMGFEGVITEGAPKALGESSAELSL